MNNNYFTQLSFCNPDDREYLTWLNVKLDKNIYHYGPIYRLPQGALPPRNLKWLMREVYHFYLGRMQSYDNAIICDAYFNVGDHLRANGYKVVLPPWITYSLSSEGMKTASAISINSLTDFNILLSESLRKRVYKLKEEIKSFLINHKTPMVLFANGEQPLYRLVIDVCKEIGVPTGVFLHGLPARYSLDDNYHPDYLFVWGRKIKENFEQLNYPSKIIVTGHPVFSQFKKYNRMEREVVVLTQSLNYTNCANQYRIEDPGLTIQYIYIVESVLKSLGYDHALLRPHPSEKLEWYTNRMDKSFYSIDNNPLDKSLSNAKFVIGPISTVILNAVYSDIPYYVFIIEPSTNRYSSPAVQPFSPGSTLPVSYTGTNLKKLIEENRCPKIEDFEGYVEDIFDISIITDLIKQQ